MKNSFSVEELRVCPPVNIDLDVCYMSSIKSVLSACPQT